MAKQRRKNTQKGSGSGTFGSAIVVLVILGLLIALYFFREGLPKMSQELTADLSSYTSADALLPTTLTGDQTIKHFAFTLSYDEETEQAEWVAYRLTSQHVKTGRERRTDDFREDELVRSGSATLDDYHRSGYDRGHLAPAADFKWDKRAMSESFYLSNMSPQLAGFNRGIWKELEEQVRDWALSEGALIIVTGPVFKNSTKTIGPNRVVVPDYYFKAILDIQPPKHKAIGFILKHEKSNATLASLSVSIDSVERFTGLDLFAALPDSTETLLEAEVNMLNWSFR